MPQRLLALDLPGVKSAKLVDRAVETLAVDVEELYVDFELAFRSHRIADVDVVFNCHKGCLALHCSLP